ncbi:cell wall-binding repeat-containing protein [Jeotgalibacillus soli]|uniref:ArsR family transcriptional regulator n=1 Tax=Jeotgalibacillus soli TaxID=889306 RepID=A0A0C2W085_9BACL|nr:ArsR family transcriptional regulator [Jeotgalibacillus soli]KIL50011.1 hypothetical protein KP78_14790 [Jeotgalibacillus soli]
MKKSIWVFLLPALLAVFLAACTDSGSSNEEMDHENMDHGDMEEMDAGDMDMEGEEGDASSDRLDEFAAAPTEMNENAVNNLVTMNTKNITRLNAENPEDTAVLTSQTVWPATHAENQPGTVILAPLENWQFSLAAADLIHHPNDGPVLFMENGEVSEQTLNEINRLNPKGNVDGAQIMIMGDASENTLGQLGEYETQQINGEDAAGFAAEIDRIYAEVSGGEFPNGVIVVSSEEEAKLYSLIAINWIAHMAEPVLYVDNNGIPEATIAALEEREEADIYVLGPDAIISSEIEKELAEYGNVTRIAGEDPVTTSIEFAKFKDEDSSFGWGLAEPGHGLSFVSSSTSDLALAAAPFSHLGKHSPLIWLEEGEVTETVYEFLAQIKPTFTDEPQNGPYNHGFLIGSDAAVPFTTQGILDDKLEIVSEDGGGHGGH